MNNDYSDENKSENNLENEKVSSTDNKNIQEGSIQEESIDNIVDKNVHVEEQNVISDKKKRGRKPKKDLSNGDTSETQSTEKVLKKRGRKPKIKTEEEVEKIPKKRGRKPKEKIFSVKELPKTFFEENKNETLILHLPINHNEH